MFFRNKQQNIEEQNQNNKYYFRNKIYNLKEIYKKFDKKSVTLFK